MGVTRVVQKPWLCGPATLEMLFSWYGIKVDQEEIAQATGLPACDLFRFGYSLYVLNRAIQRLDNGFQLLVKYDSTIDDLDCITRFQPVGIEWRCMFREPDGQLWGEGHYSLVQRVDQTRGVVSLIDPYYGENLSHNQGEVRIPQFIEDWWDENTMPDASGAETKVWTKGALFVVAPRKDSPRFASYGLAPMTPRLAFAHQIAPREIRIPLPTFIHNP